MFVRYSEYYKRDLWGADEAMDTDKYLIHVGREGGNFGNEKSLQLVTPAFAESKCPNFEKIRRITRDISNPIILGR